MGRTRRRNRQTRADRRNNNHLDRDDDYPMDGAEDDYPPFTQRRGRGGRGHHNNRGGRNKSGRKSKHRNEFGGFSNPFDELLGSLTFHEDEEDHEKLFPVRGRGGVRGGRGGGGRWGRSGTYTFQDKRDDELGVRDGSLRDANSTTDWDWAWNNGESLDDDRRNSNQPRSQDKRNNSRVTKQPSVTRVRRANLTLRNWLSSAIRYASRYVDSWSDEVGIGRAAGDEMEWQPEQELPVLIVAAGTTTTTLSSPSSSPPITSGFGGVDSKSRQSLSPSPPQSQTQTQIETQDRDPASPRTPPRRGGYRAGRSPTCLFGAPPHISISASASDRDENANANSNSPASVLSSEPTQWDLRPGTLNPEFSDETANGNNNNIGAWSAGYPGSGFEAEGQQAELKQFNSSRRQWDLPPLDLTGSLPETPPDSPPFEMSMAP
ncbi:hypothetical protein F4808DRAFT_469965 [Astrocystis sublimbata]|nr:hypothetical protein F4808DRAFT_469965 [Astrocystis sublimbata]